MLRRFVAGMTWSSFLNRKMSEEVLVGDSEEGLVGDSEGLVREHMPDERKSVTQKFVIQGEKILFKFYLTVGFYDDDRVGELFIRVAKEGETLRTVLDQWATVVSVGLQYGIPLDVFVNKAKYVQCEPAGIVECCEAVKMCKGPIDCIARYLSAKYMSDVHDEPAVDESVSDESVLEDSVVANDG